MSKPTPSTASLAASFTCCGPTVACSGPREDGHAPGLAVGLGVFAGGVQPRSGIGLEPVEVQPFPLAGVLHARLSEVLQDHGCEVLCTAKHVIAFSSLLPDRHRPSKGSSSRLARRMVAPGATEGKRKRPRLVGVPVYSVRPEPALEQSN